MPLTNVGMALVGLGPAEGPTTGNSQGLDCKRTLGCFTCTAHQATESCQRTFSIHLVFKVCSLVPTGSPLLNNTWAGPDPWPHTAPLDTAISGHAPCHALAVQAPKPDLRNIHVLIFSGLQVSIFHP